MNPLTVYLVQLAAQYGIPAVIDLLKNLGKATTIDDAIAALESANKTAEEYVAEDAKARNIPPVPLA